MNNEPFVIERIYEAAIEKVWQALTDKSEMKKWYFDLKEFKPEKGFEFRFEAGSEERKYLHLCKITEVIPGRKIAYSWRYQGFGGYSVVSFELFDEGKKTRLRLTHEGLESFPQESPDFKRESFIAGWTHIIGTSLKEFVES